MKSMRIRRKSKQLGSLSQQQQQIRKHAFRILHGLGFTRNMMLKRCKEFSGKGIFLFYVPSISSVSSKILEGGGALSSVEIRNKTRIV